MGDSQQVCTVCGHHNAADSRFCSQCGTALGLTCAVCATANAAGSRFCRSCGSPLAASGAPAVAATDSDIARYVPEELVRRIRAAQAGGAMRGERRTVTMLFADIQGSTAAAERLDPEEWAEIMNGAFAHLIAPVYRYEGTLARLAGDAILAFFGAPIAHEDDPVRAVRAGLEILEAVEGYRGEVEARTGVPIAVRVGINTGLVVVGEVGSDLRVEYTALGDAINIAARMEQTADPGTVRVAAATAELVAGMFTMSEIGPVDVKGKAEPVQALTVLGAKHTTPARADSVPLIGRDAELGLLLETVDRLRDGVGGICSLVGEAGIGKSRLLAAVRSALQQRGPVATTAGASGDIALLEAHTLSFETAVPYAAFGGVLRRWWGGDADQPPGWATIAAAVERALGTADADLAAFLAEVVGADIPADHAEMISALETPVLHQRTTDAVAQYIAAEATRRPMLLVLDDLHWADALSLALVQRLMHCADTGPVGLLLAMRPYRDDASWRLLETAGREFAHRYTAVQVEPLGQDATRDLLDALLVEERLDDDLTRRILERADGNPLFVEELVRALDSGGAAASQSAPSGRIEVPASLSGLLTARLDQLDDDGRLVAQLAAVAGAEFDPDSLTALADGGVDVPAAVIRLVREGIFVERRRVPRPVFAFRHALIQDAAYNTTLLRTRRELHARLAAHLAAAQPASVSAIADHYLAAGDTDRAFAFLVEAGEHATRRMALADAIRRFTTALDAVPADADPDLVVRAHDRLGEAYGLIPDLPQATSAYQRLLDYGRLSERPSIQVTALNRLGVATFMHAADLPRAEEYLEQARRIADSCDDQLGLAEYHLNACLLATAQGQLDVAIEHDSATARLGAAQGKAEIRLMGLFRRSLNLTNTMRYDEAIPAADEAMELALQLGDSHTLAVLRAVNSSAFALRAGDLREALRVIDEQLPGLQRLGSFNAGHLQAEAADLELRLGDVEGAIARAGEAHRFSATGDRSAVGMALSCMGMAYAVCGMRDRQAALRAEAVASLSAPMGGFFASVVWSHLGWTSLLLGEPEQAAADFSVGLGISSVTSFTARPRLLAGAAFAALDRGNAGDAGRLLDEATTFVAERAVRAHDALLAFGAGRLAMLEDRLDDAAAALERGQQLAQDSGQRLLERDVAAARSLVAHAAGDVVSAARHLALAERVSGEVAAAIADSDLRSGFTVRSAALLDTVRPVVGS
jgi:class 3 adenylate cyclase/tetratricopeptide (TPR) repeat protein